MFKSNTFKISYSCTSNLGSKIIPHNNKILNKIIINDKSNTKDKLRNCRREPCPLNNQCLVSNIIFRATVTSNKATKQYVGSTGNIKNIYVLIKNLHLRILTKDKQKTGKLPLKFKR